MSKAMWNVQIYWNFTQLNWKIWIRTVLVEFNSHVRKAEIYNPLFSVRENFDSGNGNVVSFITNKPQTGMCIWQRCGLHMWQTVTELLAVTTEALYKSSYAFSVSLALSLFHAVRLALWTSPERCLLVGSTTLRYVILLSWGKVHVMNTTLHIVSKLKLSFA